MLIEPLIVGYLSLSKINEGFTIEEDIIKGYLIYMESTQISNTLTKILNMHVLTFIKYMKNLLLF